MKLVRAFEGLQGVRRPASPRARSLRPIGVIVLGAVFVASVFHVLSGFVSEKGTCHAVCPREWYGMADSKFSDRSRVKWEARLSEFYKSDGKTCTELKRRGRDVIGYDNFNDYYPVEFKRHRADLLKEMEVHTVEGDLTDQKLMTSIMDSCQITDVVHLAAQAGVRYAKEHPMQYVQSNVQGSVTLFEAARHAQVPPAIVYASSSSVYGSNTAVPFSESDAVDHPTSLYGATKRSVELTAVVYHRLFSLSFTGLRFFTVYGPYGRPDMACFQFARAIVQQQPIQIFTSMDGTELGRDFTYVDDIVSGIVGAMDITPPSEKDKAHNEIFNLGNTSPVTVSEFVHSLERAMGQSTVKEYVTIGNTGDVLFTHANVSKAHAAFNFTPAVSLDTGLNEFAAWFKNYTAEMPKELWNYLKP